MESRQDQQDREDESPFVRVFVAAEINDTVRDKLVTAQNRLKKAEAHVSWTRPQNFHLSFAFMGGITHRQVPDVISALDLATTGTNAFSFEVKGVGFFGNRRAPRIAWAGVWCGEDLLSVQARVADLIQAAGIELEKRRYRPHLTMGRIRSARGRDDLIRALTELESEPFGTVNVTKVQLLKSVLLPTGAEYTVLHEASLNKDPLPS